VTTEPFLSNYSCITFFSSFAKSDDNLSRPFALLEFMPKSSRGGWSTTILVADDEPAILTATAMYLKECGYNVLTAEDGEEAQKAFAEAPNTIQLVISDVVMPGIRGPQLVRSIKDLSPSTATLLMSGTWSIAPEDGVALICKPFTRQNLLATVRRLLDDCDFAKVEQEQSLVRSKRLAAVSGTAAALPDDSVVTE
jgi:two-component system cell cycle sensor histidine kinase/response regulator CckA